MFPILKKGSDRHPAETQLICWNFEGISQAPSSSLCGPVKAESRGDEGSDRFQY